MNNAAICEQLERMLHSRTFASSGRQAQFLRYIVERAAAGQPSSKESAIAMDVFARGPEYDPQVDSLVRVEASKLRTRLKNYYETEGKDDLVRIEMPRGAYAPVFEFRSAPPPPDPRPSRRRLVWIAASASAIAAAGATAAVVFRRPRAPTNAAPSPPVAIAVLPFADLSPQRDQAYFCAGLTDELTHTLAGLSGLRVASTASSSRFRAGPSGGRQFDVREIGKTLNVHAVLEGSVRLEGTRMRLTAQLVETRGGFHLWSETYDREVRDALDIQRDISVAIAREFHLDLAGDRRALARPHSRDTEAYHFYLRAAHLAGTGDPDSIRQAVEHYGMALSRDQKYGLAWAGLSLAYATLFDYGMGPWQQTLANCRDAAVKAVGLAPELAESHQALGRSLLYGEWDWTGAARAFGKAIELDPSYMPARYEHARTMNVIGRHEDAIEGLRRAIALDPTANTLWLELANSYIKAGRYDEAAEPLATAQQLVKRSPAYHMLRGMIAVGKEQFREAIPHFEAALDLAPALVWSQAYLGYCYARLGRIADARTVLAKLTATTANQAVPEFEIGAIYAGLGQNDRAFEWLQQAYRRRSSAMAKINVDIRMRTLRADPRFTALLKQMRLA